MSFLSFVESSNSLEEREMERDRERERKREREGGCQDGHYHIFSPHLHCSIIRFGSSTGEDNLSWVSADKISNLLWQLTHQLIHERQRDGERRIHLSSFFHCSLTLPPIGMCA